MCTVGLVLAAVMTFVAHKVKLLVWEFDKIIPCMLIMMCCSLYSLFLYFAVANIITPLFFVNQLCKTSQDLWFIIPYAYIRQMPAFFLGVGAMLNLNKWIYFEMRILAYIKIGCGLHEIGKRPSEESKQENEGSESSDENSRTSDKGSQLFGSQMYNSGSGSGQEQFMPGDTGFFLFNSQQK
jgi:hypothetical protein